MPSYTVHYFMVKPTLVPVQSAASGSSGTVSPSSDAAATIRARVLTHFEAILTGYLEKSVVHIPGPTQSWSVQVQRIPESSPGVPNFAPVTVQGHDPILYIVTRLIDSSTGSQVTPTNRRPSLEMFSVINGHYQEIPSSLMSQARQIVRSDPQTIAGKATMFDSYIPAVAEVFGDLRMQYDADNWEDIQARALANIAFHEIAHCKAECANRASNNRWNSTISGSIHDVSGVSICASRLDGTTLPVEADFQLMGEHMLCPIRFYQLDQPIDGQFFTNDQSIQLTPRGSGSGSGSSSGSTGSGGDDPLGDLDSI